MIGTVLILGSSSARTRRLRGGAAACIGLGFPLMLAGTRPAALAAILCAATGISLAILARNVGPYGPISLCGASARMIGPTRIVFRSDAGSVCVWRDAIESAKYRRLAAYFRWNPVRGN